MEEVFVSKYLCMLTSMLLGQYGSVCKYSRVDLLLFQDLVSKQNMSPISQ